MNAKRSRNVLAVSCAFVGLSVLSGCYRDREVRHEDRHERKEDRKEEKHEEHEEEHHEH